MNQPVKFVLGDAWGFKYPSTIIMPRKPADWTKEDAFSYLRELGHYYYQDRVSCKMSERLGCELRAWDYARKCVSRETWNNELVDYSEVIPFKVPEGRPNPFVPYVAP